MYVLCTRTMVYVCVCVCCVPSGASQVMDVVETMKRLDELRERRETLASRERELDEQQRRMEQCLRNITDDTINEQYPTFTQKFIDSRIWGLCWNRVRSSGVWLLYTIVWWCIHCLLWWYMLCI